ncbi:MAG: NADP-dependent oxidoreductase [Actinomycetota bacterium]|nr:NADP-dependent oxidoreductase [Actinomycetota bacterium]
MTQTRTGREIRLASRPQGEPVTADFALAAVDVAAPSEGEILVRNLVMSVDPYMRGRMNDRKSYIPPFQVGAALEGGAVGEVVQSTVDTHKPGDVVLHMLGWRDWAVGPAGAFRVVDAAAAPPSAYLGVLGMPGLTAYAGLFAVGEMREGETVFVSGAAGAVGSLVGQLAKLRGGTVVGSAGSADKVEWLVGDLGFDAAFCYRDGPVATQLSAALERVGQDGVDVYFDNVGGEHLEAAITAMRPGGRAAICGMISAYNDTAPAPGPNNLALLVAKRLTLRGFLVSDHGGLMPEFLREMTPALTDGRIAARETVVEGLERAPEAFIGLLRGTNTGKMLVKIS